MEGISRRTVLGAATGTAAAATLLTAAGTAQAADTAGDKSTTKSPHATKGSEAPMAVTTTQQKYEGYVQNDEGEWMAHATFDSYSDIGDMWAFVDTALARVRQEYPNSTFTGNVRRYDQVITDIAHP